MESVVGWAGEIFVVDSGSEDSSIEIAREYTQNVIAHPFDNYSAQRNWAQDNLALRYEWVFHLDADERVTPELCESLQTLFATNRLQSLHGLLIARRTIFMGRWIRHGGHYPVYHLRIFRHAFGRCEDRLYDQHFTVEGETAKIRGDVIDTLTSSIESWTLRHIRWATFEVQQQLSTTAHNLFEVKGDLRGTPIQQRRWFKSSIYNRSPLFFRAFVYFFYRYVVRLGFLDGKQGLIFHILQGFWFRFYIDARLWESQRDIDSQ